MGQKHTQSEWKAMVDGTMTGRWILIYAEDDRYEDGLQELARTETVSVRESRCLNPKSRWRRQVDADEIEANARLMLAAPILLQACERLLDASARGCPSTEQFLDEAIVLARKAVAHARTAKIGEYRKYKPL